jgi:phosphoenolpyruvate-protein kinase (PTS system EI component)
MRQVKRRMRISGEEGFIRYKMDVKRMEGVEVNKEERTKKSKDQKKTAAESSNEGRGAKVSVVRTVQYRRLRRTG